MLNVKLDYLKINSNHLSTTLIDGLEFQLTPNNIYSILGKNGTGKTSLILAITKLLDENEFSFNGKIEFLGNDISHLSETELTEFRSKNIRYVLQDPIGCFDPLKNIKYYVNLLEVSTTEINEQLDYFQLPLFDEIRNKHVYELSVGMAQRLNIVLSLLAKPSVLILDEPTSALDLPISNLLMHRLREFAESKNRLVLIVTQDIIFAKNVSDYISVMANKQLSPFISSKEIDSNDSNSELTNFINRYNEILN